MKITVKFGALLAITGILLSVFVSLMVPTLSAIYDYELYSSLSFQVLNLAVGILHTIGLLFLSIALYQAEK